jgi:hypothetical protein
MMILIISVFLSVCSAAWYFYAVDAQQEVERATDRQLIVNEIAKLNPQNITIISNPNGVSVLVANGSAVLTPNNETAGKISALIPNIIHK